MTDIQDEYTLFSHKYANGVHGYVLVYSINSRQSFDMIQTIYDKILDYSGMGSMPMVIVGQKADLSGERYVPFTLLLHELMEQESHHCRRTGFGKEVESWFRRVVS